MLFDRIKHGSVDYCLYRHGRSKTLFRGPRPDFSRDYCAVLGGNETFGKYLPHPYVSLLKDQLGLPCANFSALNAGIDMYLNDPTVLLSCAEARVTVVAVTGAANLSNRFYSVHPRRNDRFVKPSKMLMTLFREVDFSEIHFTRHLLTTLLDADQTKFGIVVDELQTAWQSRMKTLLERIEGRTILFWLAHQPPSDETGLPETLGTDPLFIRQSMIDALVPVATRVVECIVPRPALDPGSGRIVPVGEEAVAAEMPGAAFHEKAVAALAPALAEML